MDYEDFSFPLMQNRAHPNRLGTELPVCLFKNYEKN